MYLQPLFFFICYYFLLHLDFRIWCFFFLFLFTRRYSCTAWLVWWWDRKGKSCTQNDTTGKKVEWNERKCRRIWCKYNFLIFLFFLGFFLWKAVTVNSSFCYLKTFLGLLSLFKWIIQFLSFTVFMHLISFTKGSSAI